MKKKGMLRKAFDRFVYEHTKKPQHYVRVERPKTLQDLRQIQFNKWSIRYGIYTGSYLPEDPNVLKRKGWRETTSPNNKTKDHLDFERKSTGQSVRYDKKAFKRGRWEDEHYHWRNGNTLSERRKQTEATKYIDRYGNVCEDGSPASHLAPKDKKYDFRK